MNCSTKPAVCARFTTALKSFLWSPQLAGASAAIHFKAASSQLFLTLSINNVSLFSSFPTLSLYLSDWLVRFFKSFSCRWMSRGCCKEQKLFSLSVRLNVSRQFGCIFPLTLSRMFFFYPHIFFRKRSQNDCPSR